QAQNLEAVADSVGMTGHLQHDVHAGASRSVHHQFQNVICSRIEDVVSLHLLRQLAPVVVDLERKDLGGAAGPGHSDAEQPDGPATDHGHGFGRDLAGQHRVHGVAQRIEHAGIIRRNRRVDLPDVGLGNLHELGECAVGVYADDLYVLADVGFAGAALV